MVSFKMYECEVCGKQSKNENDIVKCECKHYGLSMKEHREWIRMKEDVANKAHLMYVATNGESISAYEKAVELQVMFENEHGLRGGRIVSKSKLEPCRICKGNNIKIETWSSDGAMFMIKCNNPDCPVPPEGYPTGRELEKVKEEWNSRQKL